MSTTKFSEEI